MYSALLNVTKQAYQRLFGDPAGVEVMPESLELGLFKRKIPGLDILSIGTRTNSVHTPSETMYITSVAKTWALFQTIVGQLR